jgi:hypothetical protein
VASPSGNGGVILRIPDAPIGFANVPALTFGNQIGLTWTQGVENGGTAVVDYRVSFKSGSATVFTTLESNIVNVPYIATSLTPGVSYTF